MKVAPQDRVVIRSISLPLRVMDELEEKAESARMTVSAYLTKKLKADFGMK